MSAFPALNGEPVTEVHTATCRERGHATHTIDGVDTGTCPRCGAVVSENYRQGYDRGLRDSKSGRPYRLPFGKHVDWIRGYKAGYYHNPERL